MRASVAGRRGRSGSLFTHTRSGRTQNYGYALLEAETRISCVKKWSTSWTGHIPR